MSDYTTVFDYLFISVAIIFIGVIVTHIFTMFPQSIAVFKERQPPISEIDPMYSFKLVNPRALVPVYCASHLRGVTNRKGFIRINDKKCEKCQQIKGASR